MRYQSMRCYFFSWCSAESLPCGFHAHYGALTDIRKCERTWWVQVVQGLPNISWQEWRIYGWRVHLSLGSCVSVRKSLNGLLHDNIHCMTYMYVVSPTVRSYRCWYCTIVACTSMHMVISMISRMGMAHRRSEYTYNTLVCTMYCTYDKHKNKLKFSPV